MRWKPTCAGILNIWEYDDHVFEFGDGRLVLRGRNGSGKSNALSLLFPFLLDGVMSAARMDPMGGSRSMKSLLLGRDDDDRAGRFRHDSGTGYVWMELSDGLEHLSIGVGASATVHRDADPWFFVADGRVGVDIALTDAEVPLTRRQLEERLPAGAVQRSAEDYRAALDRRLFGLGPARYRSLVDLLLTLRRPHLAGKLDTDHLSATLAAGLGEVDVALIEDVAHSFDDLDAMQHELEGLTTSLDAVERFLPFYRDHLVAVGRSRASALEARRSDLRRIERDQRKAEDERSEAGSSREEVTTQLDAVEAARHDLDDTIDNIHQSPAYQSAVALAEVQKAAATARNTGNDAQARELGSAADATSAAEAVAKADRTVVDIVRSVEAAITEWLTSAGLAGIELQTSKDADRFDEQHAIATVVERRTQLDYVAGLAHSASQAAEQAERADEELTQRRDLASQATTELDDAGRTVRDVRVELAGRRGLWAERVGDLARRLDRGSPDRPTIATASPFRSVDEIDDPTDHPRDDVDLGTELTDGASSDLDLASFHVADRWVGDLLGTVQRAVDEAQRDADSQREVVSHLGEERRLVAEEPNPGPPAIATRPDATSDARAGSPLYVCVDFAEHVEADARAGLEAALEAAGILGARITADGSHQNVLDASIVSARFTEAPLRSLADVLVPVPVKELDADAIRAALASVPLDGDVVELHQDGRWRLGPLAGRYRRAEQQFIGHAVRERRRTARLAELDAQIRAERSELARREGHRAHLVELNEGLTELRATQPPTGELAGALDELRKRAIRLHERTLAVDEAQHTADEQARTAEAATTALHRAAAAARLPIDEAGLLSVRESLTTCERAGDQIATRRATLGVARDGRDEAANAFDRATERAGADRAQAEEAQVTADREAKRYDELKANVGGDAERAVEQLAAAKRQRKVHDERAQELAAEQSALGQTMATLDERLQGLNRNRTAAASEVDEAAARFTVVCSTEVAEVLDVQGVDPQADTAEAAKHLLGSTEPPAHDATNQMEKAHREVLLDGLRAGHDPSMPKVDGIDVVRVGTVDGELPIGALARSLREGHRRTSMLLSDREREIFETHLLTNIGEALRQLLLDADEFEHRINAEMAKVPTESGMVVELSWEVADDEPGLRDAIRSLRTDSNLLGVERREALREFFMGRIADLRSLEPGRGFAETLTIVLDYRSWHRFAVHARFADGKRQRVTRAFFKGLSGGEAATLLHLPLFAAAASQYSSGSVQGPRLIALDEAFAGIDDQMRSRLMGLLTQLDLDVILTSHEFWGFYGSVPSLVLYDLIRRPPNPGVFAQRFDWSSSDSDTIPTDEIA